MKCIFMQCTLCTVGLLRMSGKIGDSNALISIPGILWNIMEIQNVLGEKNDVFSVI